MTNQNLTDPADIQNWSEINELLHLKENLINLVKHHKDNCHDCDCGVSLYYARKLAEKAGVTFTDDEKRYFL